LRDTYDPWDDVRNRLDLDCLRDEALPENKGDAWWLPWLRLIVVRDGLHPTHERCVVAHELVHVDFDDVQLAGRGPDGTRLGRRAEHRADQIAAQRLIATDHLVAALVAHPNDPQGVAAELDVTPNVLRTRLEHLHPGDVARVRAAVEQLEDVA